MLFDSRILDEYGPPPGITSPRFSLEWGKYQLYMFRFTPENMFRSMAALRITKFQRRKYKTLIICSAFQNKEMLLSKPFVVLDLFPRWCVY